MPDDAQNAETGNAPADLTDPMAAAYGRTDDGGGAPDTTELVDEPTDEVAPAAEEEVAEEETEEEVAEEEVEAAPAYEPYRPDVELLYRAASLNIPADQVLEFGSDGALRAALNILESRAPATEGSTGPAGKMPELKPWEMPELPEADYGTELPGVMKGLGEHVHGQMQAVSEAVGGQLTEIRALVDDVTQAIYESRFDAIVNGLGDEWAETLGVGDASEINPQQLEGRKKLWNAVDRIVNSEAQAGRHPSMKKLIIETLPGVFGKRAEANMRKKLTGQVKGRKKIQKPASKKGPPVTDRQSALEFIQQKLDEAGVEEQTDQFDPLAAAYGRGS